MDQKQPPPRFIFGIENEFSIVWPGMSKVEYDRSSDPVIARSTDSANAASLFIYFLINNFLKPNPFRHLRRGSTETLSTEAVAACHFFWLAPNGSKIYSDSAHPEYATPECEDPYSAALFNKAGERIFEIVLRSLNQILSRTSVDDFVKNVLKTKEFLLKERLNPRLEKMWPIIIQKATSDLDGNHFGTHENYLCLREKILVKGPEQSKFDKIRINMPPFLATKQIYSGSGGF